MTTTENKGVRIGTKILLVGIPIALLAVLVSSVVAGISSRNALEQAAFERLTAVRELKAQQIEDYFDLLKGQSISLASNPETLEAISSFSYSMFLLNGLTNQFEPEEYQTVRNYYEEVIAREMNATGVVEVDTSLIGNLLPSDKLSTHIQLEYVISKDAEPSSDDGQQLQADIYYGGKIDEADAFFTDFASRFGYNDIFLIAGEDNRLIYSTERGIELGTSLNDGPHKSSNLARAVKEANILKAGEHVIADFEKYLPAFGAPTAFVASPVFNGSERIGVLALEISVGRINAVMTSHESWENVGLGKSGETYLVGKDLLLRNQSRFLIEDRDQYLELIRNIGTDEEIVRQIDSLNNSIGLQSVNTDGTQAALAGETGTLIFPDYRGIEVLSAFRPVDIAGLNWVIMSEIDKSEAFADFNRLRDSLIILASIVLAGAIYASYFLATAFTRPIRELETAAGNLTSGKLDEQIDTSAADEIGDLARSFEKMRLAMKENFESVENQKAELETEVHARTKALEEASGQLNLALSSMPNGLHMFDKDLNFVMHNQEYLDQLDIPKELVEGGKNVIEVLKFHANRGDFGEGNPEELAQDVFNQIAKRSDKYAEMETNDGRIIDFKYSQLIETGGMIIVSSDITDMKKKEADLKTQNEALTQIQVNLAESEKRIAKIIESSPDGIVTINAKGVIQTFSHSAEIIFGFYADEIIGRNIRVLIPQDKVADHNYAFERFTYGQKSKIVGHQVNVEAIKKDGSRVPIELSIEAVEMDDGEIIFIGTMRDITERLRMEADVNEARQQAETANAAKSAFLANMSHELRTPMNAIIGYSEMLAEDAEDDGLDEMLSDLGKITAAGKHLLSLINDILDLSKVEAGKMELFLETFDFKTVADEVINTAQTLAEKNGNQLVLEIGEGLGEVHNDLTKTRQMLLNMISNAAKFTSGGTITLIGERYKSGGVDWLRMAVRDTGIGIPEDKIDKIFQEFSQADDSTTRDFGGTGLGLSLTRRFAQMMGGDIRVESVVGEGSSFIIEMPLTVQKKLDGLEAEAIMAEDGREIVSTVSDINKVSDRNNPIVLVVDDEANARELLQRTLEQEGCQVYTANNGTDGLKAAAKISPDLITLDVMMPGMDGWTVLRKLKEDNDLKNIPVLMVSMVGDRAMSYELGAVDSMQKPVDRSRLRTMIKKYVNSSSKNALIVEDDSAASSTMRKFLEGEKWNVSEAVNGAEGLEHAAEKKYDLILLDLMMPVMDGFEFLHHLRDSDLPSVEAPVIIVTAKDLSPMDREKLQGSVEEIVTKTGRTIEDIIVDVRNVLAESRPPA